MFASMKRADTWDSSNPGSIKFEDACKIYEALGRKEAATGLTQSQSRFRY